MTHKDAVVFSPSRIGESLIVLAPSMVITVCGAHLMLFTKGIGLTVVRKALK